MELPTLQTLPPYFFYLLTVSTIGPLLFGYHLAELNAPQEVLTCVRKHHDSAKFLSSFPQCIPMNIFQFSVVSSIFTLGGLLGALVAGSAAGKYGRLKAMRFTTFFLTAGPVAEACAANVAAMALGRFLSGIGAGAALVIVPIYVSEISPVAQRGLFGSFTQVMCNCGILFTQFLGLFLSQGQLWRVVLGVGGIISLGQLAGLFFAIESPKWHFDHDFIGQAKENLQRIRAHSYDIRKDMISWGFSGREDEFDREGEEEELLNDGSATFVDANRGIGPVSNVVRGETLGILQTLSHPHYLRAIIAVMMVMLAQQFTGINSIVMYGVSLLSDLLQQSSALLNVCVSAVNVLVTIICAPLSDRLGRKPCLIFSILGMGISSFLLAIAIINGIKVLAAITVLTFVGSFGVGLGPLPFILASELVGPEAVGATQSLALAANWTSTFVVAQFFPILNEALGKGNVYFLFALSAGGFATFVAWYVPETKGRSVEDVWGQARREQIPEPRLEC